MIDSLEGSGPASWISAWEAATPMDLAMTDTGHRHADGMPASLLSAIKEADRLGVGPSRGASRRAPGKKDGMEP